MKKAVKQFLITVLVGALSRLGYDFKAPPHEVLKSARELEIIRGQAWESAASAFREKLAQEAAVVAEVLETAKRSGAPQDVPEGSKFIVLTDTLARALAARLRAAIGGK